MDLAEELMALGKQPAHLEKHEIKPWGKTIWIRAMSQMEKDAFEISRARNKTKDEEVNMRNYSAELVVRTMCREDGGRMYNDDRAEEIGGWPAYIVTPIRDIAQRLAAMTKDDQDFFVKSSANGTPQPASSTNSLAA